VEGAIPHDRVKRISGDFLKMVPESADAYIMRWIIHDWADPDAVTILANIRRAMRPECRLALIEWVIPETPEFTVGKWMDLHMMVLLGSRERTAAEYGELLNKAGLELERVVPTASSLSIVIGRPHA